MHILRALQKGNGKAIRLNTPICYVRLDNDAIKWFEKATHRFHSDVNLVTILGNDWEPWTKEAQLKFELDSM